jgi:hypothetical protein
MNWRAILSNVVSGIVGGTIVLLIIDPAAAKNANVIIALLMLIVASLGIFQSRISRWLLSPQLDILFDNDSSDFHPIYADNESSPKGYSCRFRIRNRGHSPTEKIECQMVKLLVKGQDAGWNSASNFQPMNLQCTGRDRKDKLPFLWDIGPGLERQIDLFTINAPKEGAEPKVHLQTTRRCPNNSHILAQGSYRLTLVITAANTKPLQRTFDIEFKGWESSAEDMFKRGLLIKMLPPHNIDL